MHRFRNRNSALPTSAPVGCRRSRKWSGDWIIPQAVNVSVRKTRTKPLSARNTIAAPQRKDYVGEALRTRYRSRRFTHGAFGSSDSSGVGSIECEWRFVTPQLDHTFYKNIAIHAKPKTPDAVFLKFRSGGRFGSIDDIGAIAGQVANTVAANNPASNIFFVGQAFSWSQESGAGCTSVTGCPYPTTARMQDMRDQALYYSEKAGRPVSMVLWYYWPDITCLNTFAGCNALANRASLRSAAFAPFPATPPP